VSTSLSLFTVSTLLRMFAVSQFYILSPRGDTIISRSYRSDEIKETSEVFFRKVKFWPGGVAPPVFNVDGINFVYLKTNGLFFVFTTRFNVSPNFCIELLSRLAKCFKDYCGLLSEEAIRKNFILIYELLDEVLDYGYPQLTSTESLKGFVHNEPVVVDIFKHGTSANGLKLPSFQAQNNTTPSTAVHKPVTMSQKQGKQRNEIFVDVVERLTMLFSNGGYVLNSEIDGCIQLKSYLSGNPALSLALNDDLVVGKTEGVIYPSSVVLDDCNFHECVRVDDFESTRTLNFVPPAGEFALMNYRITGDFLAPFRITPFIEEISPTLVEVVIKVRADIPEKNFGSNVQVIFPIARATNGVSIRLDSNIDQSAEFKGKDSRIEWTIKKFRGCSEHTMRAKITLKEASSSNVRREMGPVSLGFEIPMHNVSNLQVKYLRIQEQHKAYNPYRWVRYLTQSASYVARI